MSIGMFSIIPVPKWTWDERCIRWVIPWMPVVGGLIGATWFIAAWITSGLSMPMRAAIVVSIPLVMSGFLHLDGCMDTADAYFSRRSLDEKKRILKDSHVGAFAVIALACVFVFQVCAGMSILEENKPLVSLFFIPILARSAVGIMLLNLKTMSPTGFANMFQNGAGKPQMMFLTVLAVAAMAPSVAFGWTVVLGTLTTFATGCGVMLYLARHFEGTSGDLCGCAITLSELTGVMVVATC